MNVNYYNIIKLLNCCLTKPPIFEAGETVFWNHPHISKWLLKAHLNPDNNIGSRKHKTIDMEIEHLIKSKIFKPGDKVLDLGCGPGLYSNKLAKMGIKVTGIDLSQRSIEYAQKESEVNGTEIDYLCSDFFEVNFLKEFDGILQVNGELNTFSNMRRDELFTKLWRALKPDGHLIFDVTTRNLRSKNLLNNGWCFLESGFWRDIPHLILEQGYDYPEESVYLNRHIILDEQGIADYRFWFRDYTLKQLQAIVEKFGFKIIHVWNDLIGNGYRKDGDWIAIVAKKRP